MKTLVLYGTVSLSLLSTAAVAADLPSRRAPPVYVPPPIAAFSWTGAYIGGTAGYAFDNRNNVLFTGATGATAAAGNPTSRSNGFTGGGTIGYNFSTQSLPILNSFASGFAGGGLVFGVEADAAYTDLDKAQAFGAGGNQFSTRTNFVGTARGRLGLAFDRLMVYGTGGFAYGGIRDTVRFGGAGNFNGSNDRLQTGYAYGGGVDYALPTASFLNVFNSSAVTIKAEYIRYDLGRETFRITSNTGAGFTARNRVDGNLVRAGLNFKFGLPMAPVVARY